MAGVTQLNKVSFLKLTLQRLLSLEEGNSSGLKHLDYLVCVLISIEHVERFLDLPVQYSLDRCAMPASLSSEAQLVETLILEADSAHVHPCFFGSVPTLLAACSPGAQAGPTGWPECTGEAQSSKGWAQQLAYVARPVAQWSCR